MTLDIANRLVEMRKKHGYSQEQLAEKLGLSRQAVSKWERAEASPDTDNLILLSRLYGISLDDLLNTEAEDDAFVKGEAPPQANQNPQLDQAPEVEKATGDYVNIGRGGIHVESKRGDAVHIGWNGIHVKERGQDKVRIGKDGIFVDDDGHHFYKKDGKIVIDGVEYTAEELRRKYIWVRVPYAILALLAAAVISVIMHSWHPAWILILSIPVVDSFVKAIVYRDAHVFAFPVLMVIVFLCLGLFANLWHPGWLVFMTIPLYYTVIPPRKHSEQWYTDVDSALGQAQAPATHADRERYAGYMAIYPILVTIAFLCIGFFLNLWHPAWILFLTVPVFYMLFPGQKNGNEPEQHYEADRKNNQDSQDGE